jgi:hypothetical protein
VCKQPEDCQPAAPQVLRSLFTLAAAMLVLFGCATPIPSTTERLPIAREACRRVPLGVPLQDAAATVRDLDGTLLMGGSQSAALFVLKSPNHCGCTVELDEHGITKTSRAHCA